MFRGEHRTLIHGVGGTDATAGLHSHCVLLQSLTYLNGNRQVA